MAKEEFQIPQLLMDRENQKQKEYRERTAVDVEELGVQSGDLTQMKELDFMYGGTTTQQELDEMEEEEAMKAVDPYLKKKQRSV